MNEPPGPPKAMLGLPATPEAAGAARDFVRDTFNTAQLDGVGEIAELLTTELVTNVVRHVREPLTVRASYDGSRIRVEVDDTSTAMPQLMTPDVRDEHGRGLVIVQRLATAWGAEARENGKTVWFELDARKAGGPDQAGDTRSSSTD